MKILVCGGRDYSGQEKMDFELTKLKHRITHLIAGEAKGADAMAIKWAIRNSISYSCFIAEWSAFGKSAGPRRNKRMLIEGKPDMVVAFPGGIGTENMVSQAKEMGIPVLTIS